MAHPHDVIIAMYSLIPKRHPDYPATVGSEKFREPGRNILNTCYSPVRSSAYKTISLRHVTMNTADQ
jgi:hypothetical protein